jgi:hypothetical protein
MFLFPDGYGLFQGVNGKATGLEGSGTMWRADRDENACFADLQSAEAMRHGDAVYRKFLVHICSDFPHFRKGHGLISFIFEVESRAAMGLVADATVKRQYGAIAGGAHMAYESLRIDGLPHQFDAIFLLLMVG